MSHPKATVHGFLFHKKKKIGSIHDSNHGTHVRIAYLNLCPICMSARSTCIPHPCTKHTCYETNIAQPKYIFFQNASTIMAPIYFSLAQRVILVYMCKNSHIGSLVQFTARIHSDAMLHPCLPRFSRKKLLKTHSRLLGWSINSWSGCHCIMSIGCLFLALLQ
jgi:hypothetical protein